MISEIKIETLAEPPQTLPGIETMNEELLNKSARESHIDASNHRYPCCIVWTPIPLLTYFS